MILGLISDTHNNDRRTRRALARFEAAGVEAVLHMGDLTSPEMLGLFKDVPTWIVQGNIDYDPDGIEAACRAAGADVHYADRHEVKLGGLGIGMLHGDDADRLDSMIASGAFDLVGHGHTHAFRDAWFGKTRVVNPGAVHRTSEPGVCLYDTDAHPDDAALTRVLL